MQQRRTVLAVLIAAIPIALVGCGRQEEQPTEAAAAAPTTSAGVSAGVSRAAFGKTPGGEDVELFTLTNADGMQVKAMNYGGIITSIRVKDRQGEFEDVTLGFNELEPYLKNSPYFGAIVGRYANRIGGAQFNLDGETYELPANDGPNTLHGGDVGFDQALWRAEPFQREGEVGVVFTHTSPAGDQGFPGALTARVTYTLTDENELAFDFHATTDAPTVLNLTQHAYFNLAGEGSGDVLNHQLMINAARYTPVDEHLIPTGELAPVANTPFDFTQPTAIGARIEADHPQLELGKGYDHNFVINRQSEDEGELVLAARVVEPTSGRVMEVHTTEPGVQLYTGNFLDGSFVGKAGNAYELRNGFCLETQHFPDSPNKPSFPSTTLRPGEQFKSRTMYVFSVERDEQATSD